MAAGLIGLFSKLPPQFGQMPFNSLTTHFSQNVHLKVQTNASVDDGGNDRAHLSQEGLSLSMAGI
ncbi:MAG: hypothetical protein ACI9H8_001527 [Lysobacterales bacterium]|jgi:hypothetical protein